MNCQICNQEFTSKRSDSIYCSKSCKQKAYRANIANVTEEILCNVSDIDDRAIAQLFITECADRGIDAMDWLLLVKLEELQLILSKVTKIKRDTFILRLIDWAWETRTDYDLSDCFDTNSKRSA